MYLLGVIFIRLERYFFVFRLVVVIGFFFFEKFYYFRNF